MVARPALVGVGSRAATSMSLGAAHAWTGPMKPLARLSAATMTAKPHATRLGTQPCGRAISAILTAQTQIETGLTGRARRRTRTMKRRPSASRVGHGSAEARRRSTPLVTQDAISIGELLGLRRGRQAAH